MLLPNMNHLLLTTSPASPASAGAFPDLFHCNSYGHLEDIRETFLHQHGRMYTQSTAEVYGTSADDHSIMEKG